MRATDAEVGNRQDSDRGTGGYVPVSRKGGRAARYPARWEDRVLTFTILAGAKRHRLEPWAYLRDVVLRLCAGETDLESLLPDRWAASHPEPVLQHRLDEARRKESRQKAARQERRAMAGPTV